MAYVCVAISPSADTHAKRFIESYLRFPAGYDHERIAICNGAPPDPKYVAPVLAKGGFAPFIRSNAGWDVGGYIELAKRTKADLLFCCGESVYFHRPGWLARIANAWSENGPGMYGCFASYQVRPHLNTTAFACTPEYLAVYGTVLDRPQRYAFEHGPSSLWRRVAARGKATLLVTWDGFYEPEDWRRAPNILWRGNQSNCLVWCNHTDRFNTTSPGNRESWARNADTLRVADPLLRQ